ncbi:MAG: hypothetical protein NT090_01345, partial [Acidobacteria bacterium]|nr:hypothetical protein [Acidobacteriota bacterium]
MKYLSFDIEISDEFDVQPGEDLSQYGPFHISVAATVESGGNSRLWYSAGDGGVPARSMDRGKARELLAFLAQTQKEGWKLFAWNGLNFDLRWIGYNAEDVETAAGVALGLYDPMFQFFNRRGCPVGLAAVAEARGVRQVNLMDSAAAPREWNKG